MALLTETLNEEEKASQLVLGQAKPLFEQATAEDEVKKGSASVVPHGTKKLAAAGR